MKTQKLPDDLEPYSVEHALRVAHIIGENSAAAMALIRLGALLSDGKQPKLMHSAKARSFFVLEDATAEERGE